MRFSSWKRIVTLGLLAGLVSVVAACGEDVGEGTPYRIGVMESLTGAGETYGTVAHQAKTMAMDEINAAGGINGRGLELVVEDSKCSAQDAINAYNKLTDVDGVKIILGTSCSGAMLGVAPLAEADGVVLFSGLASNPDIADAGDYIFRTQISDIEVGIRTGDVLWTDGIRALATITEETDYAEGVRRTSVTQFEKNGGRVIAAERYAPDTTDYRSQLTKLFGASPDALHIAPQSEFAAGTIVKQARELGYQGPIYGETITVGTTALEIAGDAATGVKAITAAPDPQQCEGAGRSRRLQRTLRLHHPALAPRVRLRHRLHRGGVPQADQRRPGRRRIPGLSLRHHLERRPRRQLQLRRRRRGRGSIQGRGGGSAAGRANQRKLRLQSSGRRLGRVGAARARRVPSTE